MKKILLTIIFSTLAFASLYFGIILVAPNIMELPIAIQALSACIVLLGSYIVGSITYGELSGAFTTRIIKD